MPGRPEGLPTSSIDLGTVNWRADVARDVRLTWARYAPYEISADSAAPLVVRVMASKAVPGRFALTITIDWDSPAFTHRPSIRGHVLDAHVTVRWPGDEAKFRVRGTLLYPAVVTATPESLDLGTVDLRQQVRATLLLASTAATTVQIEPSAWLARCDAAGRPLTSPLRLPASAPVRVPLVVQWDPIVERMDQVTSRKPVRPTGKVTVRWDGGAIDVPAQMIVRRR